MKLRIAFLLTVLTLPSLPVPVLVRGPAGPWPPPDRPTGAPLPDGLTAAEWASIREQIRQDRRGSRSGGRWQRERGGRSTESRRPERCWRWGRTGE